VTLPFNKSISGTTVGAHHASIQHTSLHLTMPNYPAPIPILLSLAFARYRPLPTAGAAV
jgi:hypothetical protein